MANEKDKNGKLNKVSRIFSAAIGATVASTTSGVIGATAAAVLSATVNEIINDVCARFLSKKETNRINTTAKVAIETINKNLEEGKQIREDNFFTEDLKGVEEIFEGCLMVSKNSYEEAKAVHLGYLFANICFDKTVTKELANQFINIADQLTYSHLCIIKFYANSKSRNLIPLAQSASFNKNFRDMRKHGVFQQIRQLESYGFLTTNESSAELNYIIPSRVEILSFGKLIYNLMQLNEISDEDVEKVVKPLDRNNI